MATPSVFVKVPKERVGVLIGPEGRNKTHIEEKLKVKLQIDSETGNVDIILSPQTDDPSVLFRAREVVTAIGRGFSPENAFRLLNDEEAIFELLDLHDVVGKSEADLKRIRGRVIGENGRTRRLIEELTETHVSVYGHTIGIIGDAEQVEIAKQAVKMLLKGGLHATVYRFLHAKRMELKKKKLELWESPKERLEE